MNILVAEDEKDIRELLELHLTKEGYKVFQAENGINAIKAFQENHIDLAILDVMMPGINGFKVIKKIRENSEIPVIFLTARGEDIDKILGLGLGADDYIAKPFNPLEVVARVAALLRRCYRYTNSSCQSENIINGKLELDKESCVLYKHSKVIELNAKEYKIIEFLMDNLAKVYTKKKLYENVWEEPYYGDDNTIMVHISHIREKIEDNPKKPKYLKTIRGIGYKMEKI